MCPHMCPVLICVLCPYTTGVLQGEMGDLTRDVSPYRDRDRGREREREREREKERDAERLG